MAVRLGSLEGKILARKYSFIKVIRSIMVALFICSSCIGENRRFIAGYGAFNR